MNYIQHLNTVFGKFYRDDRLHTGHISLYMALFQYWNLSHFTPTFHISRRKVMQLAAIRSKSTYHRCIRDLHQWKYLHYVPSKNSHRGSRVTLWQFPDEEVPSSGQERPESGHATGLCSPIKGQDSSLSGQHSPVNGIYTKTGKHTNTIGKNECPIEEHAILSFFRKKNWPEGEGQKFFSHYQSTGWKTGGGISITDWQAAAGKWMLKAEEIKKGRQGHDPDYLKTKKSH